MAVLGYSSQECMDTMLCVMYKHMGAGTAFAAGHLNCICLRQGVRPYQLVPVLDIPQNHAYKDELPNAT